MVRMLEGNEGEMSREDVCFLFLGHGYICALAAACLPCTTVALRRKGHVDAKTHQATVETTMKLIFVCCKRE